MRLFVSDFRKVSKNNNKTRYENYKNIKVDKTEKMEKGMEELKIWD